MGARPGGVPDSSPAIYRRGYAGATSRPVGTAETSLVDVTTDSGGLLSKVPPEPQIPSGKG